MTDPVADEPGVATAGADPGPAGPALAVGDPPGRGASGGSTTSSDGARRSNRTRWTALAVGAVLVGLVAVLAAGSGQGTTAANALLGQRVPHVAGPTIDGGTYDIDQSRGRWVIVNFFATWCAGCIHEHPELVAFNQWAQDSGQAEVVAVVFNDPVDAVRAFFAENGGGWPVLDAPALPIEFQVSQIPETFVVSPRGQVVQHVPGEIRADDLITFIEDNS